MNVIEKRMRDTERKSRRWVRDNPDAAARLVVGAAWAPVIVAAALAIPFLIKVIVTLLS